MDSTQQVKMKAMLHALFLGALFMTASFFAGLFTELGADDESMSGAVTLAIGMLSSVAFFSVGLGFLIGGKYQKIFWIHKVIPFIAFPILFMASIKESYFDWFGDVSNVFVGMGGIAISFILGIPSLMALLKSRKEEKNGV